MDHSKTNTYEVTYNFRTGVYENNNIPLKVHVPTVFRIININRWAYDIDIKLRDSVLALSYSMEELSKELSKDGNILPEDGEKKNTSPGEESSPLLSEKDLSDDTDKNNTTQKEDYVKLLNQALRAQAERNYIEELRSQLKRLQESLLSQNATLLTDPKQSVQELDREIASPKSAEENDSLVLLRNRLQDILLKDSLIKTREEELKSLETTEKSVKIFMTNADLVIKNFEKLRGHYRNLIRIKEYSYSLYTIANDPQLTYDRFTQKHKEYCTEITRSLPWLSNEVDLFKEVYYDLVHNYDEMKYNYELRNMLKEEGWNKMHDRVNQLKKRADNMNSKVESEKLKKEIAGIQYTAGSLSHEDTYQWTSTPFQATKDVVIFDVEIKKKNNDHQDTRKPRKFRHEEFTKGGIRTDLGIGLAMSYFDNAPQYELGRNDDDQIIITQQSDYQAVPSLIGMFTVSHRSPEYVTWGGSAGLGIDVVNGKIQLSNFFAGPSIIFGKYERITLSAGISVRNVGRLKSGYETETYIISDPLSDIKDYMTDRYKIGSFMSITYNLTKGIKSNVKKIYSLF